MVPNNASMYNVMRKLIEKRFYPNAEEAQNKLDVFYACNRLTDEEYAELTSLVEQMYGNEPEVAE